MLEQSFAIVFRMLKLTVPALFFVQYLRASGHLRFLDRYSMAIVRFTGFEQTVGQAFFASFGSAYAGGGLLVEMYHQKRLTLAGLILGTTYISIGPHLRILITLSIPAAFSLLPLPVALGYIAFMVANGLLKSISAGLLSHVFTICEESGEENRQAAQPAPTEVSENPLKTALLSTWRISWRGIIFAFTSSIVIGWLDACGAFTNIPLSPETLGLPATSVEIFAAWTAHLYAGMGMVGQRVIEGEINTLEAMRVCIFCAVATRPISFLREAPGYHFGIFGPKVGLCLFAYHMTLLLLMGAGVLLLF